MAKYSLAEMLHMKVAYVEAMTYDEFNGWIAYFQLRHRDGNS